MAAKIGKKRLIPAFSRPSSPKCLLLYLNNDKIFPRNEYTLYFCDREKKDIRMNIRNILFALVSVWTFASCANGYLIEGTSSVSRLDGKMLFVMVPSGEEMCRVDSAEVVHGFFQMQGELDTTVMASLYMDDQSIMPLVVEKGNIKIQIDNARITVSGTPLNDRLYDFIAQKNQLDDKAYEVERMESRLIMDGMSLDDVEAEVKREREKLNVELDELVKGFIQANYENVNNTGVGCHFLL